MPSSSSASKGVIGTRLRRTRRRRRQWRVRGVEEEEKEEAESAGQEREVGLKSRRNSGTVSGGEKELGSQEEEEV